MHYKTWQKAKLCHLKTKNYSLNSLRYVLIWLQHLWTELWCKMFSRDNWEVSIQLEIWHKKIVLQMLKPARCDIKFSMETAILQRQYATGWRGCYIKSGKSCIYKMPWTRGDSFINSRGDEKPANYQANSLWIHGKVECVTAPIHSTSLNSGEAHIWKHHHYAPTDGGGELGGGVSSLWIHDS